MRQLSEIKGQISLCKPVFELYDVREQDRSSRAGLSGKEIEELLAAIFKTNIDVRIIIDALDECRGWKMLFQILRDAGKHHPGKLKIFCSSRTDVIVEGYFPDRTLKFMTTKLTADDMDYFVRHEILSRETPRRLLRGQYPSLEEELVEALLARAGGMYELRNLDSKNVGPTDYIRFKWVELELSLLFDNRGETEPIKSKRDLEEKIKELKNGISEGDKLLYDTYHQIFKRNVGRQGSHAETDLVRAFKMILCSCVPLGFHALAEAVRVEKQDSIDYFNTKIYEEVTEEYLSSISHDFLMENAKGEVGFSHMSAVDYLRNHSESKRTKTGSPLDCHLEMMNACLYFVQSRSHCGVASHERGGESIPEGVLSLNTARKCFLRYAYGYWARHCAVAIRLSGTDCTWALCLADKVFANKEWSEAFQQWADEIKRRYSDYDYIFSGVLPREIRTCADNDPGIFIAACYGLPRLIDAIASTSPESNSVLVNRQNYANQSALEISLDEESFASYDAWRENWSYGVWK